MRKIPAAMATQLNMCLFRKSQKKLVNASHMGLIIYGGL